MSQSMTSRFNLRRKAIQVDPEKLVSQCPLVCADKPGIKLSAMLSNLSLSDWFTNNRERFDQLLDEHGAVLLRGFKPVPVPEFNALIQSIDGTPLEYRNRSTPRSELSKGVFTSTDYPKEEFIPHHNEMAYTQSWPKRLYFNCVIEPGRDGQTPIADSANVYDRLSPELRFRFEQHGVMYVRNYRPGMDLSWQQVFQTEDKAEVARYCNAHEIEYDWLSEDWLRTRQRCQASIRHRVHKRKLWFNQAHLFHVSNLPSSTQEELMTSFTEDELPRNAYFGNGEPIPRSDLDQIRQAYADEETAFDWQCGDVFIIDNEAVTHARRPFEQPRQVVVAMT